LPSERFRLGCGTPVESKARRRKDSSMMDVKDITIGMHVRAGITNPREVLVYAEPYMVLGRWRVPVEYRTGEREDLPLVLLYVSTKRPSARRGRGASGVTSIHNIVDEFNELLPDDQRVTEEQLAVKLQKVGRCGQ
jgi:hypothetical protein